MLLKGTDVVLTNFMEALLCLCRPTLIQFKEGCKTALIQLGQLVPMYDMIPAMNILNEY